MKRWKRVVPGLFALAVGVSWAGGDIHVKQGETWRIGPDQANLSLDSLTLDDEARIEFAPEVNFWQLSADIVRIGKNVMIDGNGTAGKDGADGQASTPAKACENGMAGGNGGAGGLGEEGVTMVLNLGVQQLGSLKISSRGGNGGHGGDGTPGQNAGELDGCELTHGGEGGDGGRGGEGGNGGQVRLGVALKAPNLTLDFLKQRIAIESEGGKGGNPGKGADGGEGSPGRWLSMKTLSGDKKFVAGGQAGKDGKDGSAGPSGRPGVIDITEDIKQRVNAMIEAGNRQMETIAADISGQKSAQLVQIVQQLQQQVGTLQSQVKALQTQSTAQKAANDAAMKEIEALKKQLKMP